MKVSRLIKILQEYQEKHGDIEVLSCPKEFYIATGSNYFTDDLNIDCNDDTLDWEGKQAIKIYGYI